MDRQVLATVSIDVRELVLPKVVAVLAAELAHRVLHRSGLWFRCTGMPHA
jgi:hypothetical protein